jgi:hypothetical protein
VASSVPWNRIDPGIASFAKGARSRHVVSSVTPIVALAVAVGLVGCLPVPSIRRDAPAIDGQMMGPSAERRVKRVTDFTDDDVRTGRACERDGDVTTTDAAGPSTSTPRGASAPSFPLRRPDLAGPALRARRRRPDRPGVELRTHRADTRPVALTPASLFASALSRMMNRIVVPPGSYSVRGDVERAADRSTSAHRAGRAARL